MSSYFGKIIIFVLHKIVYYETFKHLELPHDFFSSWYLLLTSCEDGKVEITPYILNLHLKYTHIDNFEHGIARVSMDTKTESGRETAVYGCIDERGKEVIFCIYELVFVEPGGIVALSKEGCTNFLSIATVG